MDEMEMNLLANLHGRVRGFKEHLTECYSFFTEDYFAYHTSDIWLPFKGKPHHSLSFPGIEDKELQGLVEDWLQVRDRFHKLNMSWTNALLRYFNWGEPKDVQGWHHFRKAIDEHRRSNGASWMQEPLSQEYMLEMQKLITKTNYLTPLIKQKMAEIYQDRLPTFDDLGDQRAKDLIDKAEGEADLRKAVALLNKAIEYGESGIQASKAFIGLGMRYEDLGEIESAVDAYSKALKAWKPFALIYFERGRLYYQLQQWAQALKDFEQALAFPSEEGLPSSEHKEAEQYIMDIRGKLSD